MFRPRSRGYMTPSASPPSATAVAARAARQGRPEGELEAASRGRGCLH